jgi:hypothetical protein
LIGKSAGEKPFGKPKHRGEDKIMKDVKKEDGRR